MNTSVTTWQREQAIALAVEPGLTYQIEGPEGAHHVLAGLLEKRAIVEEQGVLAGRVWTLAEIASVEGVLWPVNPTLGQVLDALAPNEPVPVDPLP